MLLRAGQDFDFELHEDGTWDWRGPSGVLGALQAPGLLGEFQVGNAAAVLALLDAAGLAQGIDASLINHELPAVSLAGRSQRMIFDGDEWLFDVAHSDGGLVAALVHGLGTGAVGGVSTSALGFDQVTYLVARVAVEVFAGAELRRVDEDGDDNHVGPGPGRAN